jgi:hypothetical protein
MALVYQLVLSGNHASMVPVNARPVPFLWLRVPVRLFQPVRVVKRSR